jgi:demethylmenaquinone methyltransferase/2-methoxy-6-polyprenyl-1,4-benzoquinol methylase
VTAANQESSNLRGLSPETWKRVVKAIEDSIPLYDQVNDLISLGKAQEARNFALSRLELRDGISILDSGIGPGPTSRLILSAVRPSLLVGLDGSVKQLKTAKENLSSSGSEVLQTVRGSFEFLPFREGTFDAIITCYALRDSLDISKSLAEYSRVCGPTGLFADVDIGKPENVLRRAGSILYIRFIMPLIAKIVILGRMRGNPWRMIAPTYKSLPTNPSLLSEVGRRFQRVEFKEFLMGGIIVIIGRKSSGQ